MFFAMIELLTVPWPERPAPIPWLPVIVLFCTNRLPEKLPKNARKAIPPPLPLTALLPAMVLLRIVNAADPDE